MNKKPNSYYFVAIAGTGMAPVAGLLKEQGYTVSGSDQSIYPPMSTMLEELQIHVDSPFDPKNIDRNKDAYFVIANVLSKNHPEVTRIQELGARYGSFPQVLHDAFLTQRTSVVVAGTHGKTTTTSLLAHCLRELGEDPSFMIGGIPKNFKRGFHLGKGNLFLIEGDEYDTAYFDKGSKFFHYAPKFIILNNVEYDHADIFESLDQVETAFKTFLGLIPDPRHIIANVDDPGVKKILQELDLLDKVTRVSGFAKDPSAHLSVSHIGERAIHAGKTIWKGLITSTRWPHLNGFSFETLLNGAHNLCNIGQVIAAIAVLTEAKAMPHSLSLERLGQALAQFEGVKRRLDFLGSHAGVEIYEDFAHHPTAVNFVIESFRKSHPQKRLIVAFEPKNATSRRNTFHKEYVAAFQRADLVLIGECRKDLKVQEQSRFDPTALTRDIGENAHAFEQNSEIPAWLLSQVRPNDAVIFMSSGSFSGIPSQFISQLSTELKAALHLDQALEHN